MERGAAWLRLPGKPQTQCLVLERRRQMIADRPSSRPPLPGNPQGPLSREILSCYLLYAIPTGYCFFTHLYPFPQLDLKLLEGKDQGN